MTADTNADLTSARAATVRFVAARFVVRVGSEWSPIRAALIRPIADALAADVESDPALAALGPSVEGSADRMVLDLVDSGMIAPPRPRRRRERPVSSRAVFYQSTEA